MRAGTLIALGAANGLVATMLAAAGAHALPATVGPEGVALFRQAADFHLFHALALLATGLVPIPACAPWASRAGLLFQAGILAFSGSLYLRALLGPGSLGAFHWITPFGGLLLMAGWACLIVAGLRARAG